ncbi:5'-nucleotidase [candidate division TA06 bacterium DG_78]|uniref:5'-nucleotidase n=1 Tax=candidate division TA06 bacterium DG_78 TaxID=1703772 RepID=A0A0S7YE41_UNCT6|nr:MAG: 5'-nucleotidase [candidate division TA06 bacterium DG_78]
MKTYDIILFDLDGTLTDPKAGITKSIQYALAKLGIIEENQNKLEPFIGPPLLESFKKFYSFGDSKARQAVDYYREYFSNKGIFENNVYRGIPELLKQLYDKKKRLILATSKPTIYSERILKYFDLYKYFYFIFGSNLDLTLTSKTEIIKNVLLKLMDYQKNQVIMIGDRKEDVIGAQQNGLDSIAVTYGYGSNEELKKVNPTYIIHSVEELKLLMYS